MGGAIQEQILHTGQHYDRPCRISFLELGIPAPAFHLGIGGGSHGANTGRMLEAIEQVLLEQGQMRCWSMEIPIPRWLAGSCQQAQDSCGARGGRSAIF